MGRAAGGRGKWTVIVKFIVYIDYRIFVDQKGPVAGLSRVTTDVSSPDARVCTRVPVEVACGPDSTLSRRTAAHRFHSVPRGAPPVTSRAGRDTRATHTRYRCLRRRGAPKITAPNTVCCLRSPIPVFGALYRMRCPAPSPKDGFTSFAPSC